MVELVHGQKFSERAEPSQSEWGGLLFGSNVRLSGRDRKEYARPPQQRAMPAGRRTPMLRCSVSVHLGLGDIGFAEGRNVAIEYRFADGSPARPITDLTQHKVGAIVLAGSPLTEELFAGSEWLRRWNSIRRGDRARVSVPGCLRVISPIRPVRSSCARTSTAPGIRASTIPARTTGRTPKVCTGRPTKAATTVGAIPGLTAYQ